MVDIRQHYFVKMCILKTDSSHGRVNAVITQDCNYSNQKMCFPYHVIRRLHYYNFSLMISEPVILQRKKHYEPKLFHCNQPLMSKASLTD